MTIEDQNGVDRVDRKALWPHFLNKEKRFCFVAHRVTNMRWGRRCWDCPKSKPSNVKGLTLKSRLGLRRGAPSQAACCRLLKWAICAIELLLTGLLFHRKSSLLVGGSWPIPWSNPSEESRSLQRGVIREIRCRLPSTGRQKAAID